MLKLQSKKKMKISQVSVSVGETFAKKRTKYESWRTDIGYTASLEEGENPNEVRKALLDKATHDLKIMKADIYKEECKDTF